MFKWLFASALAQSVEAVSETTAPVVETAAFSDTLMGKGLITTGFGLAGVFLVLCLFYLAIKLMQKIKEKE